MSLSLPVQAACKLNDAPDQQRWLIEGLWVDEGVGIIGGQPKCCKSFMALDLAVAVASGKPCLGQYSVKTSGKVLLFAGEDALSVVKRRLSGIAKAYDTDLNSLDIQVITVPVLRIDDPQQRQSLTETVKEHRPKLLVLDPFIRMHRIDENNSGEVSALLAYLRAINRMFHVAVALVHHSSKRGNIRAGQALRGSSEFHAWGDSFLYLQRQRDDGLYLTVEHRSESSKAAVALELQEGKDSLALRQRSANVPHQQLQATDEDRILEILAAATSPITLEQIRVSSQLRRNTVCTIVKTLVETAKVTRTESGYQAATQ